MNKFFACGLLIGCFISLCAMIVGPALVYTLFCMSLAAIVLDRVVTSFARIS